MIKENEMNVQYNGLSIGDRVACNGYAMRVTRLVEWDKAHQLIEATNGRGGVCVDSCNVHKLTTECPLGTKI